jgi:hypothetical protein
VRVLTEKLTMKGLCRMYDEFAERPFERVLVEAAIYTRDLPVIAICADEATRAIAGIGVNFDPVVAVTKCLADAQAQNGWSPAAGRPRYVAADPTLLRNAPAAGFATVTDVPNHLKLFSTALVLGLSEHLKVRARSSEESTKMLTCRVIQWAVRENNVPNNISLLSPEERWRRGIARYSNRVDFPACNSSGPRVLRTEVLAGGLIEIGSSMYSARQLAEMHSSAGSVVPICLFPTDRTNVWVIADPDPFPARRVPDLSDVSA